MISVSSIPSHSPKVVVRRINDESLLIPLTSDIADMDSLYRLNETGAFIWEKIDGKRNISDITAIDGRRVRCGSRRSGKGPSLFYCGGSGISRIFRRVIIDLNIASFIIRLQSEDDTLLTPGERFSAFVSTAGAEPDIVLKVYAGKAYVPKGAEKVFTAPLVEETTEGLQNSQEPFWYVSKGIDTLYVQARVIDPASWPLLIIPENKNVWHIFLGLNRSEGDPVPFPVDPLPYPLDGLLLYYLISKKGGLMIHGSGVITDGRGWLFSGKSGQGKTTIAKIFDGCGDRVIHDDRLVLRKGAEGWVMHSTPVYRNDEPRSEKLDHLWLISHGQANISTPVSGAEAAGLILANCIQQNWDGGATAKMAAAVEDLVSSVAVSRLQFVPDRSVRDYLLIRSDRGMSDAALAARELLKEELEIVITAGGYSMWPALRPGDRLIISTVKADTGPANGGEVSPGLVVGDVVAVSRDGGFVAHRITGDEGH